jgi:hypothetical protein
MSEMGVSAHGPLVGIKVYWKSEGSDGYGEPAASSCTGALL